MSDGPYHIITLQVDFAEGNLEDELNKFVLEHPGWRLLNVLSSAAPSAMGWGDRRSLRLYDTLWVDCDALLKLP